jgi:hypothetical protein
MSPGEKQAAVHHDQWNAGRPSNQRKINEALRNALVAFLFLNITIGYLL